MKGITSITKSTVKELMKLSSKIPKLVHFGIYTAVKMGKQLPKRWTYNVNNDEGYYVYL